MTYLLKRNNHYYYNRRVPDLVRPLDPRDTVRISLHTDSKRQAWRKAVMLNDEVEAYWQSLAGGQLHDNARFGKVVHIARQMGFAYQPLSVVVNLPIEQLCGRVIALQDAAPHQVEAVLGGKESPQPDLSQTLEEYWKLSKDKISGKSPDQVRKWRNQRIKAIKNFTLVVGNNLLKDITRDEIITFRDWWLERTQLKEKSKSPKSANKEFIILKGILELVSDHFKAGLDIGYLFKKIRLQTRFKQTKLPFKLEQITALFHDPRLAGLNKQARYALFAAAETGARPSELVGLLPEDIRLAHPVPHIAITDRKDRMLKTTHSQRVIPLVGYALEAFKACPQGFPQYRDKPDNLTNTVNKFLKENKLRPTERHTMYSMRHGFQDRILSVNTPDRVQAELMGHKFQRPQYGDGATLEQKKEWLDKICVKHP